MSRTGTSQVHPVLTLSCRRTAHILNKATPRSLVIMDE